MTKYFLLLLLFLSIAAQSQEQSQVTGRVLNDSLPLGNVHIKNVTSGKFSVSNASGEFLLSLKAGDTLVLSHVAMNDLISFIISEDLLQPQVIFRMSENSSELREVVINKNSDINVVSLGIIPKKIEKLSENERRLRTAGDFKLIHLLGILGGSLEIDPILNAINGRTKRLKRNIGIEKKQKQIAHLEINYLEYMKKDMALTKQEIGYLISEAIEDEELETVIATGNEAQMKIFLQERWFRFQDRLQNNQNEK